MLQIGNLSRPRLDGPRIGKEGAQGRAQCLSPVTTHPLSPAFRLPPLFLRPLQAGKLQPALFLPSLLPSVALACPGASIESGPGRRAPLCLSQRSRVPSSSSPPISAQAEGKEPKERPCDTCRVHATCSPPLNRCNPSSTCNYSAHLYGTNQHGHEPTFNCIFPIPTPYQLEAFVLPSVPSPSFLPRISSILRFSRLRASFSIKGSFLFLFSWHVTRGYLITEVRISPS